MKIPHTCAKTMALNLEHVRFFFLSFGELVGNGGTIIIPHLRKHASVKILIHGSERVVFFHARL